MSEEKPTFKVTDRRLFNTDGTPREGAREEIEASEAAASAPTAAAPASSTAVAGEATAADAPAARAKTAGDGGGAGGGNAATAAAATTPDTIAEAAAGREASATAPPAMGDDDPQEFLMVVEFIASFAAEALGMSAHPMAAGMPPQINLPLAKQCIDMLGTLQKKTRGNLNAEEKQFFDLILSQLRMQYVSLSSPRAGGVGGAGPRGFTGHDITGGR